MNRSRKPLEFGSCPLVVLCGHMQPNPRKLLGCPWFCGVGAALTVGFRRVKPWLGIIFDLNLMGRRLRHDPKSDWHVTKAIAAGTNFPLRYGSGPVWQP